MMTIIMLSVLNGGITTGRVVWMFFAQLGIGALLGCLIAQLAVHVLNKIRFVTSGFDSLFLMGVAVLAYAFPSMLGGNGYLSVYIVGIILGNHELHNKKEMVHYFDGFTGLMQVLIFFMLGLLAHPADLGGSILPAAVIFVALILLVRPNDESIEFHKLIPLHFVMNVCVKGGMYLFCYPFMLNLTIFAYLFFYLCCLFYRRSDSAI